jgi:hypothetical protein
MPVFVVQGGRKDITRETTETPVFFAAVCKDTSRGSGIRQNSVELGPDFWRIPLQETH